MYETDLMAHCYRIDKNVLEEFKKICGNVQRKTGTVFKVFSKVYREAWSHVTVQDKLSLYRRKSEGDSINLMYRIEYS